MNPQAGTETIEMALQVGRAKLAAAQISTSALDAQLLLAMALGTSREALLLGRRDLPITAEQAETFAALIARRCRHEPLAHISGTREFWSLPFSVTANTLIPRPDSECLVEATIASLKNIPAPRLIDLGTGSGCLLLSSLSELLDGFGVGVDRSERAVHIALRNARALGLAARTAFAVSDWDSAISSAAPFDHLLCNPPYIPASDLSGLEPEVARYEPTGALSPGEDGLAAYPAVLEAAMRLLRRGGSACIEFGLGQQHQLTEMSIAKGFQAGLINDLTDRPRALWLVKP